MALGPLPRTWMLFRFATDMDVPSQERRRPWYQAFGP
jgi:hypothetical protein